MSEPDVIFITGANSGFGAAVAREALARGLRVFATARDPETLGALREAGGARVATAALDVTDEAAVAAAVAAAMDRFERIDLLHNNAGYGSMGGVEEVPMAEIRAQMDTNLFGALAVMRAVLPHMRAARCGTIVNMSSVAGFVGGPGYGIYAASKFALEALSETVAAEAGGLGVRVLIVEPSGFRTDFHGRSLKAADGTIEDYADTAGRATRGQRALDGHQAGDPVAAARAMLDAATMDDPPTRLALGNDAIERMREKLSQVAADLDRMEEVTRGADRATEAVA